MNHAAAQANSALYLCVESVQAQRFPAAYIRGLSWRSVTHPVAPLAIWDPVARRASVPSWKPAGTAGISTWISRADEFARSHRPPYHLIRRYGSKWHPEEAHPARRW